MPKIAVRIAVSLWLVCHLCGSAAAVSLRVKDLVTINDGGTHKLIGYGLVVGLQGTGDGKKAVFTIRSLANMLQQFGVSVDAAEIDVANVAAVIVTAELPTHAMNGTKMDVTASSMGDAKSLQGGTLLVTPLRGADGEVYAVAQGSVSIGGFSAGKDNANVSKNHAAVGRVPNGAAIVRSPSGMPQSASAGGRHLALQLHQPDFTTAQRVAESINAGLGGGQARAVTAATVQLHVPADCANVTELITRIENLPVEPDMAARVVVNERTGTVVIGARVRILPVAIAHGALTVRAERRYQVSQPNPLVYAPDNTSIQSQQLDVITPAPSSDAVGSSETPASSPSNQVEAAATQPVIVPPRNAGGARTIVVPDDVVDVDEAGAQVMAVGGEATLDDLVAALNTLGVSPRDLIAIIQALKEAGALQAELVIQ